MNIAKIVLDITALVIFSLEHIVFQNANVFYCISSTSKMRAIFDSGESLLYCKFRTRQTLHPRWTRDVTNSPRSLSTLRWSASIVRRLWLVWRDRAWSVQVGPSSYVTSLSSMILEAFCSLLFELQVILDAFCFCPPFIIYYLKS